MVAIHSHGLKVDDHLAVSLHSLSELTGCALVMVARYDNSIVDIDVTVSIISYLW